MNLKKLLLALSCLAVLPVYPQATLTMDDFSIMPGESRQVTIDMTNTVPIRAFQVQVVFPEGVTMASRPTVVADRQGSYEDEFGETVQCTKTLGYNKWEDGSYMITVNADDAIPFSGTEGPVITFKVKAADDAPLGESVITLQDMELVFENGYDYVRPASSICRVTVYHTHIPGDDGVCTLCGEPLELVIDDSGETCADFVPEYTTYAKAAYKREFDTGYTYSMVLLPFAPDAGSLNNFRFYSMSSVSDNAVTFVEEPFPAANTPYLCCLREDATVTDAITGGVTTVSTEPVTVSCGTWQFVGSFVNGEIDCTQDATTCNYVFNPVQNTLHRVTRTLTLCPYSAYIRNVLASPSAVSNLRVYISHPTGIKEISKDEVTPFVTGMYDLQGRPVSKPIEGQIYIRNGVKEIKK
ncbi:MAG: hypothetical protein IJX44_07640 [Bacteroidaceae bacterium]|nr:hypothetical protein [Bacteroidaceae bacterium]